MRGVRAMLAAFTAAGLLILTVPPARAGTLAVSVSLAPYIAGSFTGGNGVNSHWVQVQHDWKGPSASSQLYDGIYSLADANVALGLTTGDPGFLRSADAVMGTVNAGNDGFNTLYTAKWGAANLPPLFVTGDPNQENYVGHITGYIAVTTPGAYNFGVLADDGFRFTLFGAGASESMALDGLNNPDRWGFGNNLELSDGLYRFDLVGYNRLDVGVLNLGWWQAPNASTFGIIPQSHLYTAVPAPVPLPAAVWLMGSGLLGLLGVARRRTAAPA